MAAGAPPPPDGAWPFLIARTRNVGYRTVLAPPLLLDRNLHPALMREVEQPAHPDPTGTGLLRREVRGADIDYTIVFRRVQADRSWLDQGAGILHDGAGRPFSVTEGVLLAGSHRALDAEVFEVAHHLAMTAFRRFWQADDQNAQTIPAPRLVAGETPVLPESPPAARVRSFPPKRAQPAPTHATPVAPSPLPPLSRRRRSSSCLMLIMVVLALVAVLVVGLSTG